ncbi:hypothetical protein [Polaribacter atrinae]|uniref:hypothetical protein n=1 Tax=Polaribacter atrinae TaxID=1333662 RepID=UPI000AE16CC4|nr:hypothetical protein [Polaribacter atrinae]
MKNDKQSDLILDFDSENSYNKRAIDISKNDKYADVKIGKKKAPKFSDEKK